MHLIGADNRHSTAWSGNFWFFGVCFFSFGERANESYAHCTYERIELTVHTHAFGVYVRRIRFIRF